MSGSVIERILSNLEESDNDSVTEKTASDGSDGAAGTDDASLLATVRGISKEIKTASADENTPKESASGNLETMAKEAQEAEKERLTKEANFMGAALADGFMQRFAAYDDALSGYEVKTASNGDAEKIAQAAYNKAIEDMEKTAADEYERGYKEQLVAVHKIASDVHYTGQAVASHILETASDS